MLVFLRFDISRGGSIHLNEGDGQFPRFYGTRNILLGY
jgi:hypothetical protein